ncbi:hypothetical protein LEP1GSC066_0286 [Leptospira sp. serovar Kenya str. Sh9]|nr:hypothetical protein LEP1GSC066_0286 [Leptospira sp. serovar Kenya str. Sh9]
MSSNSKENEKWIWEEKTIRQVFKKCKRAPRRLRRIGFIAFVRRFHSV